MVASPRKKTMNNIIKSSSLDRQKKPGRPKKSEGVLATLERLTGQIPCPDYLRDAANKYLRSDLFQVPREMGKKSNNETKLAQEGAHQLLMNALYLDQLLNGDTATVLKIMMGDIGEDELGKLLVIADREVTRLSLIHI
mgnify:CR=1 FL=1